MGTATKLYPLGSPRPIRSNTSSDVVLVFGTFVFSNSYISGGESLTAADMGLVEVFWCQPTAAAATAVVGGETRRHAINAVYDVTNKKMIAIAGSAAVASGGGLNVEVADDTDLSRFTVRYIAAGRIASK